MTIEQFCNKLEIFLYSHIVKEKDNGDDDLFFEYEWDSETWWIKLGLPQEWFDGEDDKEFWDRIKEVKNA